MTSTKDDVGKLCVFYDPRRVRYDALITEVWGPACVNVVYVNDADGARDNYGQKLLRETSVSHGSQQAHGRFYLMPGETLPPIPVD